MHLPFVGAEQLAELLPMPDAIDVVQETFAAIPGPTSPTRQHIDVPGGQLLLMPSSGPVGTGVKLITVAKDNPGRGLPLIHGIYVLFSPEALQPVALFDGAGLTRLRTAAVSGVATRFLAREDARSLVVFGSGVQGEAHIEAMKVVRAIEDVIVIDRRSGDPTAVKEADIVCTCTTSRKPLFAGNLLQEGAHVNAIGAYQPDARELDDAAVTRGRVVVETREATLGEAGDLAIPLREGVLARDQIEELSDVVARHPRASDEEITVFKSVGVAFEDLAIAAAAFERLNG